MLSWFLSTAAPIRTILFTNKQIVNNLSASNSCCLLLRSRNMSETLFLGKSDRFKGITVKSVDEPCSGPEFKIKLQNSLQKWTAEGIRGVWFYVHPDNSDWIPQLVSNGFSFHNANPERLALMKWLPKNEANQIPSYAHHMVGVGGMVINENEEVLAISEKYQTMPHWKLPGGYVDPGEDLFEAAIREVKEETGIDTEFQSVIAFRHAHGYNFGCSDLYIIVHLKPLTFDIKICERELSDCRWMPIEEYANNPLVNNINKHFVKKYLEYRKSGVKIGKEHMILQIVASQTYTWEPWRPMQSFLSTHVQNEDMEARDNILIYFTFLL